MKILLHEDKFVSRVKFARVLFLHELKNKKRLKKKQNLFYAFNIQQLKFNIQFIYKIIKSYKLLYRYINYINQYVHSAG